MARRLDSFFEIHFFKTKMKVFIKASEFQKQRALDRKIARPEVSSFEIDRAFLVRPRFQADWNGPTLENGTLRISRYRNSIGLQPTGSGNTIVVDEGQPIALGHG